VPKKNCYSLDIPSKEAPEDMKYMPLTLEAVLPTHQKSQMKRFTCDFYKQSGHCETLEVLPLKEERRQKNKFLMLCIVMCYGDSVEIEYKVFENGIEYCHKRVLESGQALLVDQRQKIFSFRVVRVLPGTKPAELVLKEGSLIVKYEQN